MKSLCPLTLYKANKINQTTQTSNLYEYYMFHVQYADMILIICCWDAEAKEVFQSPL